MSKNFDFFNAILSELLPEGLNITGRAYMNNNGDTHHFEVKDGKFVEVSEPASANEDKKTIGEINEEKDSNGSNKQETKTCETREEVASPQYDEWAQGWAQRLKTRNTQLSRMLDDARTVNKLLEKENVELKKRVQTLESKFNLLKQTASCFNDIFED